MQGEAFMLDVLIGIIALPTAIIWLWNRVLVGMNAFVWDAYRYTGIIGTPIHEASHALACLLFGMKIQRIVLYAPNPLTGTLGYVTFLYRANSITHAVGRVVQGVAPMITAAALMFLLMDIGSTMPKPGSVTLWSWVVSGGQTTLRNAGELFFSGWSGAGLVLLASLMALHLIPSVSDVQVSLGGLFVVLLVTGLTLLGLDLLQANAIALGIDRFMGVDLYLYGGIALDAIEHILWMGVLGVTATLVMAIIGSLLVVLLPSILHYAVNFVRGARGEV